MTNHISDEVVFDSGLAFADNIVYDTTTTDGAINQTVYDTITENINEFNFKNQKDIEVAAQLVVDHLKSAVNMDVKFNAVIAIFKMQLRQLR